MRMGNASLLASLLFSAALHTTCGSPVAFYPTFKAMLEGVKGFGAWSSIVQGDPDRPYEAFTNALAELQSEDFSNTLAGAFSRRLGRARVPDHMLLICTNAFGRGEVTMDLAYRNSPTNASATDLLHDCLDWYIHTRLRHSLAYSRDSMLELASPTKQRFLFAMEERLARNYHIPPGWLQHSATNSLFYVVDAPLAWVYETEPPYSPTCEDAQEFDPKVRPTLDSAREAVWKRYNGRRPYSRVYYREVQQLLKTHYNINWQSPLDLNPGMIIDF